MTLLNISFKEPFISMKGKNSLPDSSRLRKVKYLEKYLGCAHREEKKLDLLSVLAVTVLAWERTKTLEEDHHRVG